MSLVEQQTGFAYDIARLIIHINAERYTCTSGEAFRIAGQAALYARQSAGIVSSHWII